MPIIGGYHEIAGGVFSDATSAPKSPLLEKDLYSDVIGKSHHSNSIPQEKRSIISAVALDTILCSSKPTVEEQNKCWTTVGEATGGSLAGLALIAFVLWRCCRTPRPRARQRQERNSDNELSNVGRDLHYRSLGAIRPTAPIPPAHLAV
jgi:hypothetical protein